VPDALKCSVFHHDIMKLQYFYCKNPFTRKIYYPGSLQRPPFCMLLNIACMESWTCRMGNDLTEQLRLVRLLLALQEE